MNKRLQAEFWEVQTILYWILGFMIIHWGDMPFFGWLCIAWGWITFVAAVHQVHEAKKKEK